MRRHAAFFWGSWTSIEVAENIPCDDSPIVHGRCVSLGYFDREAATRLDDGNAR